MGISSINLTRKEHIKHSTFTGNMVSYIENPKELTKNTPGTNKQL